MKRNNPYDIGNWTTSTLKTLRFIKEQNDINKLPKLKDLPSGTYRNWVYPLKNGGYLQNGKGFSLTLKGLELLEQLTKNPPKDRRGRRSGYKKRTSKLSRQEVNTEEKTQIPKNNIYEVSVKGSEMVFQALVTEQEAKDIIKSIQDIKGKK